MEGRLSHRGTGSPWNWLWEPRPPAFDDMACYATDAELLSRVTDKAFGGNQGDAPRPRVLHGI